MRTIVPALLLMAMTLAVVPAAAQVPGLELSQPAPVVAPVTEAPAGPATADAHTEAADWVRSSLHATADALEGAKAGVQDATGLTDQQLYGIGIGVLAGVAAADILGTGGLGSLAVVSIGGMIGNWAVTRADTP